MVVLLYINNQCICKNIEIYDSFNGDDAILSVSFKTDTFNGSMLLIAGPLSKYTSEYADQGSTEYQYFSKIFLYKVRYPYEMMLPFKGYLSHHYFSHVKF